MLKSIHVAYLNGKQNQSVSVCRSYLSKLQILAVASLTWRSCFRWSGIAILLCCSCNLILSVTEVAVKHCVDKSRSYT